MNSCRIQLKCRFLAGFEKGTSEGILPLQRTQKNIQGLHLISVPSVPCYNCLKIHVIQKRWTPQIAMCWIFFWVTYGDVNWLLKWGTVYIPPPYSNGGKGTSMMTPIRCRCLWPCRFDILWNGVATCGFTGLELARWMGRVVGQKTAE